MNDHQKKESEEAIKLFDPLDEIGRCTPIDKIMEQAQVFASALSLVGGRFDSGNGLADAKEAKNELRALIERGVLPSLPATTLRGAEEAPQPVAWMVDKNFKELFSDLEEAHKYAAAIGANVVNLYTAIDAARAALAAQEADKAQPAPAVHERASFEAWMRRSVGGDRWDVAWQAWQERATMGTQPAPAVEADAARLDAIEKACHTGVIKLNDYLGACPQYIYWGGNGGKTLREAIDAALSERTKGTT